MVRGTGAQDCYSFVSCQRARDSIRLQSGCESQHGARMGPDHKRKWDPKMGENVRRCAKIMPVLPVLGDFELHYSKTIEPLRRYGSCTGRILLSTSYRDVGKVFMTSQIRV